MNNIMKLFLLISMILSFPVFAKDKECALVCYGMNFKIYDFSDSKNCEFKDGKWSFNREGYNNEMLFEITGATCVNITIDRR